ncbi:cache domain-containing sensor histidine kinase [Neobacillus bataviensis]|uniref:cache domain-containing sensor histidine kinase n=1 Tax=Neobacillus bataviensis TaxID=220685 RepID=UPI001CBD3B88|nr:sensor histidine kinase [Neobacillus bataviensis]
MFFRNKSLYFKLICIFITIILLSIAISTSFPAHEYTNLIEQQANEHTRKDIEQVKKNIELHIKELENITEYLSRNENVTDFFLAQKLDTGLESKIKKQMKMYTDTHPQIAGILIVNKSDLLISNEMSRMTRDSLMNESWYKQAVNAPSIIHLESRPIGRNLTTNPKYSADDVLSVTKAVTNEKTGDVLGVILIDWKLDTINNEIKNMGFGAHGFVYIIDEQSRIVYTPVNKIVYRIKDSWFSNRKSGSFNKSIQENEYQVMYDYSKYTKWKIVGVFSINETLAFIKDMRWTAGIIAMVVLILAIFAATFFTSSITRPLSKLSSLMKKAAQGDLDNKFESKNEDEIKHLGDSFNSMIDSIKNLLNLINLIEKRKREAELKVLQEQIKPHFLYNTFDTIKWMALEYQAKDIMDVIDALTKLFRIGLSKGKESIRVAEEIEHIESYLIIQMTRYEDKFDYVIEVQEEVKELFVLKLILQPLVENSIYHAIKTKKGRGKIWIQVKIIDNRLLLSITDDGKGINPELITKLNERLQKTGMIGGEDTSGYGMLNVNERIKLTFGNDFGLNVRSIENKGTTVEIWHPIVRDVLG